MKAVTYPALGCVSAMCILCYVVFTVFPSFQGCMFKFNGLGYSSEQHEKPKMKQAVYYDETGLQHALAYNLQFVLLFYSSFLQQ